VCRQDEENLKIVALSNLIDVVNFFLVLHKILLVAKIVTVNNFLALTVKWKLDGDGVVTLFYVSGAQFMRFCEEK